MGEEVARLLDQAEKLDSMLTLLEEVRSQAQRSATLLERSRANLQRLALDVGHEEESRLREVIGWLDEALRELRDG